MPGFVGALGRLHRQPAVENRTRVGGRTAGTRAFLTSVDDLGDAEGAQLGKCVRVHALDPVPAREVHADRLRRQLG